MDQIRYLPIAMTPRSGSTAFCSCLEVAGLSKQVGEVLNPRGPQQYFKELTGAESDLDMLQKCAQFSFDGYLSVFKVSALDFEAAVEKHPALPAILGNKWIYIDRDDKVAQGLSLFTAKKTGEWHRQVQNDGESREARKISYDFAGIDAEVKRCEKETAYWESFFLENDLSPVRVSYEEFASDPDATVRRVMQELDLVLHFDNKTSKTSVLPVFGWFASKFDYLTCRGSHIEPKYKKFSDAETVREYKLRYAQDIEEQSDYNRE